ncbi:MAG: SufS family cysteine desulfurase [Acetatifactor sp.]|nr:SufS family cysteine desulfurase [Acetatifactor sp.]
MNVFRQDFPILKDPDYIYFDNAATAQKPACVMEAISKFYETENANPLRGLYKWSVMATESYEAAREKVANFLGARKASEIVFTRNATESLNLIAYSYGRANVNEGDEIVVAVSEHHSNILPWQMVAKEKNAKLVWLECDENGYYSDEELNNKITSKTRIVAIAQVSNVLGVPKPIKKIADIAHSVGAVIVVDGAQSAPHMAVNVQAMDADFFVFSGHKLMGPMGIGVLYGKHELLNDMPPFLTGGEMIEYVTRENATYAEIPHKFEAGTVNAADAVGLAAAIDYIKSVGFEYITETEKNLTALLMEEMRAIPHVTVYGSPKAKDHCGIVTFNIDGCHPHDVSSILDADHICIRAGHHCAQPLLQYMNVNATCRASMYFYNTEDEVHRFAKSLAKVREELGYGS